MKKNLKIMISALLIFIMIPSLAFAYSFAYSSWPSSTQTAVDNAYYNNYLAYDGGYNRLTLDQFRSSSNAYSTLSNPSWSNSSNWAYPHFNTSSDISSVSDVSVVARMIYAENTNVGTGSTRQQAMEYTAQVVMNRAANGGYGGTTPRSVVLASGQFSSMNDGNIGATNPIYYTSDLDAWSYASMLGNHIIIGDFGSSLGSNYYNFYDTQSSSGGTTTVFKRADGSSCTSVSDIVNNAVYYGSSRITASPVAVASTIYFSY